MGAEQIKEILHLRIEEADESFLRILHAMTEAYKQEQEAAALEAEIMSIPPNPDWKPMTQEEMMAHLEESEAQIERGEYVTLEELRKESEQW